LSFITPNYNPDPLAPEIYIYNIADVLQYTFQTSATQGSPTKDFILRSLKIHLGVNSDYGNATLVIDDPSNLLTNLSSLRRESKIQRQWKIKIKLGKSNGTLYNAFTGIIFDAFVNRPGTNTQQIVLDCVGWAVRLRDRQTAIKRIQAKTTDGLTLDTTDNKVKVSQLLLDLLHGEDHYITGLNSETHLNTQVSNQISYLKFERNLNDSQSINHGSITGTELYADGVYGKCLDLNGSSRVTLLNETTFDYEHTQPFSIAFWMKNSQASGTDRFFVGKTSAIGGAAGFSVFQESGSALTRFRLRDTGTNYDVDTTGALNNGQWHHIVVTFSGNSNRSGMKIYVDGVLNNTGTSSAIGASILNNVQVTIGAESDNGVPLTGQIDDVRIYNKELNSSEVSILYNAPLRTTDVVDTDIKLPDLQTDFESWASILDFLASAGKSLYYIDPDLRVYYGDPNSNDSGFLFTNDLDVSNLDSQNWDSTKIGYIRNIPINFGDSSYEGAFSVLHGFGGVKDTLDLDVTTTNATYTAHETNYIAIPITPTKDNISKIALKLSKTGNPANDANIQIIGQDGSGTPEELDLRIAFKFPKNKVAALTSTPSMTEIAMTETLNVVPRTQIYVVINKYGTSGNEINADYQTGTGTYYTSTDGVTWGSNVGRFAIRTYHSKAINVTLENTTAKNKYGTREKAIPFRNKIDEATVREALINASENLAREKRTYSGVIVSAPTARIPLGKFCRLYDKFNGLDIKAQIVGVDLEMMAGTESNIGTNRISLTLSDYHY
jgi:hypothetical protein